MVPLLLTDILRYGAVSAIGLAVDFGVLLGLHEGAGFNHLVAGAIGFGLGFVTVYWLSITHVFAGRRSLPPRLEFGGFLAIGLAGLVLTEILLFGFVDAAGLLVPDAKMLTAGLVFGFNFAARRQFLFTTGVPSEG